MDRDPMLMLLAAQLALVWYALQLPWWLLPGVGVGLALGGLWAWLMTAGK